MAQKVTFPFMLDPYDSFIWVCHTLAIVAGEREFLERK